MAGNHHLTIKKFILHKHFNGSWPTATIWTVLSPKWLIGNSRVKKNPGTCRRYQKLTQYLQVSDRANQQVQNSAHVTNSTRFLECSTWYKTALLRDTCLDKIKQLIMVWLTLKADLVLYNLWMKTTMKMSTWAQRMERDVSGTVCSKGGRKLYMGFASAVYTCVTMDAILPTIINNMKL